MTAADAPEAARRWWQVRQAGPAIYGTIIGGSVMAATEEHTPVGEVAATVVVTLIVYWLAERWSFLLGSQMTGQKVTVRHAREVFAEGWSMVQASYLPLLVMLIASFVGADSDLAVDLALGATIVVLVELGYTAAHRAGRTGWALAGSAGFTGLLGVLLVLLKAFVTH